MRGLWTRPGVRLTGAIAALVFAGASTAGATGPSSTLQQQVQTLQSRTQHALLDLYSLDSRLADAQSRLAALQSRAARLRDERVLLTHQVAATGQTLKTSQHELAANLRMLYERGDVNTLAVLLGAQSLQDALTQLDALSRTSDQAQQVVAVTRAAKARLARLRAALAERSARVDAAVAAARSTAAALAAARADRLSFIAHLRADERLKNAQITQLEAASQNDVATSSQLEPPTVAQPESPTAAPAPGGSGTITVLSTGYSLGGHTATGLPVGWGVVAVDPSVIPLGTRLTIPGYGEGVAADVGGSVRGDMVDLWFPSLAQAQAWGRRTITITLHS